MVRFQVAARHICLLPVVHASSGTHMPSYSVCTLILPPSVRWSEPEACLSSPSSAEVGMSGAVSPVGHMSLWHAKRQLVICLLSHRAFTAVVNHF